MEDRQYHKEQLLAVLETLPASDIYRDIVDCEGNLLAKGSIPVSPHLVEAYRKVNFLGKTVVDLGCNFGFFSFQARELGARQVTAVDYLPAVVEGAGHYAAHLGVSGVDFQVFNIERPETALGTFDIALLVDFFGKSNIRKQKIDGLLDFLQTLSQKELLMAFRPINRIKKDLRMTEEQFLKLYPSSYVRHGAFYLVDYVRDYLADRWTMEAVSEYRGEVTKAKHLFLCRRL